MFSQSGLYTAFQRTELKICARANRRCSGTRWMGFFALLSKLGDGYIWYGLMAALALFGGARGAVASLHLAIVGLASLVLYKTIKSLSKRQRPMQRSFNFDLAVAPLDEFSFPSGHTLHAVVFSLVACHYFPWLVTLLLPLTVGIALSRVVLGLHYPSDVLAAILLAYPLYGFSLTLIQQLPALI